MGLRITSAADYAIRAMIHLACLPDGGHALRDDIAQAERIPSSFMAKILRSLVRAQLLRSSRGVNGGFALARPASEIHMLEIVEAVEGPLHLTLCAGDRDGCEQAVGCPAAPVWEAVQENMKAILRNTTLETLVSTPRRHGRVTPTPQLKVVKSREVCRGA
jgi:Rrf2 family protein